MSQEDQVEEQTPTVEISDGVSNRLEAEDTPLIQNETDSHTPKDDHHKVFLVFVLVGMTTLLPWNFFISLNNFWDYKFRDTNASANSSVPTELQVEFTSYLAIASTVPNAIFVIVNAMIGQRFTLKKRLSTSISVMILAFTLITALAFADTDEWQKTFLVILLALVVIVNMNSAVFQGGSFGMAGKFPEKYMSAQMVGQAFGGVFPALVDIVIVSLNVKEEDVGAVCFAIATVVLLTCFVSLFWVMRNPFFLHYYGGHHDLNDQETTQMSMRDFVEVVKISWTYLVSIVANFAITLTLFPSVAVLVQSETYASKSDWAVKYFTPVSVFLLFNVGDLIGRGLASWVKMPGPSKIGQSLLLFMTLSRLFFVPLFLYCNIVTDHPQSRNVIFQSDADFIIFMALFAVSNGYIGNICMLFGPQKTDDREKKESIALVLIAGLVLGTGIGSFLSYPVVSSL